MEEIWKDVVGYEGLYSVSSFGRIRSEQGQYKGKILKEQLNEYWKYYSTNLNKGRAVKRFSIHTLVAKAFVENPRNLPEVHHIDGNKTNNASCNLRWVTKSENIRHNFTSLGIKMWNRKPVVKIDPHTNQEIEGYESIMDAVKSLGFTRDVVSSISRCAKGKSELAFGFKWKYKV